MYMPRMISFLAVVIAIVYAEKSFSPVDEAIWIDRLNYFRSTGLPWSAANMQRVGWKADLAKTAASNAAKCSATTGPGVNVYQSSSSKSSSIIDQAIQQWVVETSKKTLRTLAQPDASGDEIGKGTYNSYSQIVWAPTTSVGCASASCSEGEMVVCQFSPPGNDGSSAWYVHADPASKCPSGTTASQGLCVDKGDAANKHIAPIPAGKLTDEVYPAYVANIKTVLIEAARGIANGEKPSTVPPAATTAITAASTSPTAAPTSSSLETSLVSLKKDGGGTKSSATDETPSFLETPSAGLKKDVGGTKTSATDETPSSMETSSMSLKKDVGGTKTSATDETPSSMETSSVSLKKDVGGTKTSATDETPSSMETPSVGLKKDVGDTKTSATDETPSSLISDNSDLDALSPSPETSKASTPTSKISDKTSTHSSVETTTGKKSSTRKVLPGEDLVPGTVKASSDNDSISTNEETSTKNQASSRPASTPSTGNDASVSASAPMSVSGPVTSKALGSGMSVAGMTGIVVLAIVGIATFGVVMSYKRNQRRQREIMRDGGIRVN